MSSYVVKEREREWDTTSIRSHREPHHYTTVRRYKVPEREDRRDDRTVIDFKDSHEDDEVKIVRRESRREHDDRDVVSYRVVKREDSPSPERTHIRIVREHERSPSPVREYRFERERDRAWDRSSLSSRPYELEKYSKSTEYFSRPEPQPIIIRNEIPQPVIIRDEPRREREVIIEREVERTKSVRSASSSPSRAPSPRVDMVARSEQLEEIRSRHSETALIPAPLPPPQEDYYYERVIREVDRPRQRRDDEYREPKRERHRDHWSDDDVLIEKRIVEREESPHVKRHLAEGAVAGIAASALMNHHRRKQGESTKHRGRQAIGYAAIGAVGAEALARANHAWRDRSRDRSEDEYYDSRDGRRRGGYDEERSRSRSKSHGRRNTVLAIAGLAAVGAAAYAAGKRGKGDTTIIEEAPRRSRSRRRRHSVSGASERSRSRSRSGGSDRATNPQHRNRRIAQAGLAGAALAGLAEHRSKSRGKSKTRIQEGVPIVAAGLGSAAAAGLYENFKARRERKKSAERGGSRSRSRARDYSRSVSGSRSRSRSRSTHRSGRRAAQAADTGAMVQYGADPLYNDHDRQRSRSRGRSRSNSPRRRSHSRSRSRGQNLATAAAAAGVTGLAVNEARKRRERKREEKERRRREEEESQQQQQDGYYDPMQYYPATNQFPPPPPSTTTGYGPQQGHDPYQAPPPPIQSQAYDSYQQPAAYNPADFPAQPGVPVPPHQQQQYYQQARDAPTPAQDYYQQHPPPHGEHRNPEDVSAPPAPEHNGEARVSSPAPTNVEPTPEPEIVAEHQAPVEEQSNPAKLPAEPPVAPPAPSTPKTVHFNLPDTSPERFRHHRRRHSDTANDYRADRNDEQYGKSQRTDSPDSVGSGETVELPRRFDERGRRIPENEDEAMAMQIEDFLKGRNTAGRIFRQFADDILVGNSSSSHHRRR